jgi:general secretion pathway protein A
MYRAFYDLERMPFQISTDPAFLWLGEKHKEALATLKYGILENKGFLLLTGDVGTGKTTLINALTSSLGDDVIVAKVPDPGMEKMDLMNYISHAFQMGKEFARKDAFLVHFGHFLNTAYARRQKVLLIIDESQRFSRELLEEVRLLSNIEKNEAKLLNIFLVGQNEFNDVLLESGNRALRQRITLNYSLEPLNIEETGQLVQYRLRVAGAKTEIFDSGALRAIYEFSKGFPRKINIICDHCMILGFVTGRKRITAQMVKECADEMRLPVSPRTLRSEQPILVKEPVQSEESFVDEEIPAVEHLQRSEPLPEPSGNGLNAVFIVMLLVVGLAYLTPGGREIVYKVRGYGKDFVTVADNYIPALSAERSGGSESVVSNKTLLEIPQEKVISRTVRQPLNVLPVKTGPANVVLPSVVPSVALSESIATELEKNPPSAGNSIVTDKSADAEMNEPDPVAHSGAEPAAVNSEDAEVISVSDTVPQIVEESVPVEPLEPVQPIPPAAEAVDSGQGFPGSDEESDNEKVVLLAQSKKAVAGTERSIPDKESPIIEPPGNPKPVEEVVTTEIIVAEKVALSPIAGVEPVEDLPVGSNEKSMEGYPEEMVRVLYDLEVAEYRDVTVESVQPDDTFAEISSEAPEPVKVSDSVDEKMEDVKTLVKPIETEKAAAADPVNLSADTPAQRASGGLEENEIQVISVVRSTSPPRQEKEKDLSSLFADMKISKSAENSAAVRSESAIIANEQQHVNPGDPIDPGKVIDWVLSNRAQ